MESPSIEACPLHGITMLFAPAHGLYACQDVDCEFGHGAIRCTGFEHRYGRGAFCGQCGGKRWVAVGATPDSEETT